MPQELASDGDAACGIRSGTLTGTNEERPMAELLEAPEGSRRRDPEGTRRDILRIATAAFADRGFAGARVDEIAELTQTTKRMIYYYFGSKEGLYLRVIEEAYRGIRDLERHLDVEDLDPADALRRLAETTFDHHTSHRDFVRLVQIENIHRAEHILRSEVIHDLNTPAIDTLRAVMRRGIAEGVFRSAQQRRIHEQNRFMTGH